jgi:hypothetical protein
MFDSSSWQLVILARPSVEVSGSRKKIKKNCVSAG